MDSKFPVVDVAKGAFAAPFAHSRELIGSFIAMFLTVGITAGYGMSNGLTLDILTSIGDPDQPELLEQYAAVIGQTYLLAIFTIGPVSAALFNYWVRLGAFGKDQTDFANKSEFAGAIIVNMLKFALIFLFIGLVSVVLGFVMSLLGVGASPEELAAAIDGDVSLATVVTNLINLIVICIIYSLFSANLTQTALKSDKEDLKHPHTMDFALVLLLLYLVTFIPSTLVSLTGISWVNMAMQATLGVYIAFSIAVAHGLRYRICVAEKEAEEEA